MLKKIILLIVLLFPWPVLAHDGAVDNHEEILSAKIIEITAEKEIIKEDGSKIIQQNLKLRGLKGQWKNRTFNFEGISDLEVIGNNRYKKGDKVLVNYIQNDEGRETFLVFDYVRTGSLYLLAAIFAIVTLLVGRKKGLKALISLILSFLIILYFIVPQILSGGNALTISLVGGFLILVIMIYLTEGFNKKSHLAIISIFISLLITFLLSWLFTYLARLSGLAQEEAIYLTGITKTPLNFQGLLLAGILIGTLGVLDDIILSQIEAVEQLKIANHDLTRREIFRSAFSIGNTHLGAAINTLFLTYAGAALPLLLLFSIKQPPFMSFSQVINSEMIAAEIVRTLTGSIGIALALPIATIIATYSIKPGKGVKI
ncbi:MAG: YibE/F family protein [Patescibacteria group bacterium]|mgnify:FL=1